MAIGVHGRAMFCNIIDFPYEKVCRRCGNIINEKFCVHCGAERIEISEEVKNEIENSFPKNTYVVECNNCAQIVKVDSTSNTFIKFCPSCGSNDVYVLDERLKRNYCHNCGYPLSEEFCSHCGSERIERTNLNLEHDTTEYIVQCKRCNAETEEYGYIGNSVKVCKECGSIDIVKYDSRQRRKICNKCGYPIIGKYCSHCGTEVLFKDKNLLMDSTTHVGRHSWVCDSCKCSFDTECEKINFCIRCGNDGVKIDDSPNLFEEWM